MSYDRQEKLEGDLRLSNNRLLIGLAALGLLLIVAGAWLMINAKPSEALPVPEESSD